MLTIASSLLTQALAQGGPPPSLEGTWLGSLEAGPGVKLRLAFHISKSAKGGLTGTLDSLDQGANGLPLGAIKLSGSAVSIEVTTPPASYTGTLNSEGTEITGEWHQGGASLPLNVKKVDTIPVMDHPQEPKGPFPYQAEDVTYPSKATGRAARWHSDASGIGRPISSGFS